MTKNNVLITSALPYANGPLHIGHMVEHIQTDIYVNFRRLLGDNVQFCCADDTHGTPIEVNAAKQGKTPVEFIKIWYDKHVSDMNNYKIKHDSYYTTHSDESKHFTELIFNRLKEKGDIYQKEIELMYDPKEKRFLPDRYIKGTCPKCSAEDQYGDNCEKCGTIYEPTDLINPRSVISGETPIKKMSNHYFFKLSNYSDKLKDYLENNKLLQPEIKKQILNWIKEGLKDWNISRDAPYFGFLIPEEKDKYFYVWLDAPIGYMASLANSLGSTDKVEEFWNNSEVIHFIGKDIIYFHLLFWPAVLMGSEFKPADNVVVHGFMNVNGEKMSKSRGTFITALDFSKKADPEFLRFYLAGDLTHSMTDLDLDLERFQAKVNNELVSNLSNFAYRTLSFTNKNFDSKITTINDKELLKKIIEITKLIQINYSNFEFRKVIKHILEIGSLGNKYFQDKQPWVLVKENIDDAQLVLTDCVNILKILAVVIRPILPEFSNNIEQQLNIKKQNWSDINNTIENHTINKANIIYKKIEDIKLELPKKEEKDVINPMSKLNLKVAKIVSASDHPKADKLLLVKIDLGNDEKRQLVAGLKPFYDDPQILVGKHIICVTNLEHANLRGEMSQGMMLAAETKDTKTVKVLVAPNSKPGDQVYIKGIKPETKTIKFDDFMKVKFYVKDNKAMYEGKQLQTDTEKIKTEIETGNIR
jgi:methionyl-tRNA synthetase